MIQIRITSLFLFLLLLGGCLLHPPYDKAAVVLYNKTPGNISYSVFSENTWSDPVNISTGNTDYAMMYDIIDNDALPPKVFQKIQITATTCKIVLDRKAIENNFKRDPGGRKGWDLYVTTGLLKDYGCRSK